ncbi:MAG: response regulator [Pirellulales bacterium]|nr:response regulator [Pirellulales bacterium]
MKSRILFVDDEPKVLAGLRRMLRRRHAEWDMVFVSSGREALERMAQAPFNVVVSDMKMPEMDGAQLLSEVRKRYPTTVRLILSGYVEGESVLRTVGPAHQFLAKPCDSKTLICTIESAVQLRELLKSEELQTLLASLDTLPTPSVTYTELLEELRSPRSSARSMARIIERDAAMMAETLKLTNSAYFARSSRVTTAMQAVQILGFETLQTLVVKVGIFSRYRGADGSSSLIETISRVANKIAITAKAVARAEDLEPYVIEQAFCAGMLSLVGSLVLIDNCRPRYRNAMSLVRTGGFTMAEAERLTFGCTQAEVGAYLLGLWGFNDPIVEAVAYQDCPRSCGYRGGINALTAVHIARALSGFEAGLATNCTDRLLGLDRQYLAELDAVERLPVWQASTGSL